MLNSDKEPVLEKTMEAMKKYEIIWNELKCAEKGLSLANPLIFLDPKMHIPWDM